MGRVGIREVAAHAGVSTASVSNYLNRPGRVADATARKIGSAIDELGFVRNNAGRQLRLGQSSFIAHIVPDVSNPSLGRVAEGIEERAAKAGLAVFLANTRDNVEKELAYLELFEEQGVRGVLVLPRGRVEPTLAAMRERGTPSVVIGRQGATPDQPSVSIDNVAGGYQAVKHLLDTGRRRIAVVGGPLAIPQVSDRLEGAGRAIKEVSGATLELLTVERRDLATGSAVGADLAQRSPGQLPEGIFAVNDQLGAGIEQSARNRGLRIPDDLAIVGYDDTDLARTAMTPLTSARPPYEEFGRAAVDLLISLMENGSEGEQATQLVFAPDLVVRESTQPATYSAE
ncbi:LacI family transcriptional regulator [Kribbella pittospori]|uniref:LacI family transcriptional regulator n=1 Tax=Kribbella pittospori TaxID=722689 RepID=A0A4R0JUM9_9ACTN|nr:LacI family DNA-binding transcriptional regulator [Kribbella pittospori]TCC50340.1 LacI family transcriptional regulator [Kribbella pittospori]